MQLAKKSALGLGLVVAMLASTIPVSDAHAITPRQIATLSIGLSTVPYLINYSTRKPQEEPRFDKSKLLHGSLIEKIKHLHYFISDTVFGWPYKDKKVSIVKNDFGKDVFDIQSKQFSGGWFGNFHAWVLYGGGKALMFTGTVTMYLGMWAAGIQWWMNPSLKAPNVEEAQKMLSSIVLLQAVTR